VLTIDEVVGACPHRGATDRCGTAAGVARRVVVAEVGEGTERDDATGKAPARKSGGTRRFTTAATSEGARRRVPPVPAVVRCAQQWGCGAPAPSGDLSRRVATRSWAIGHGARALGEIVTSDNDCSPRNSREPPAVAACGLPGRPAVRFGLSWSWPGPVRADNAEIRAAATSRRRASDTKSRGPGRVLVPRVQWPEQVLAARPIPGPAHDGEQGNVQPFQVRAFAGGVDE